MVIARVTTDLTGTEVTGGGSQDFYFFGSAGDERDMVEAASDFWAGVAADLHVGNTATTSDVVTNIDETDGSVVSIVTTAGGPIAVNFSLVGEPLPRATQAMVRWATTGVVNNRAVKGRTFIPAVTEGRSDTGRPNAELVADIDGSAEALIANALTQLVIWSRPAPSRPGSQHTVLSSSVWSEFAVLRSRRD